MLRLRRAAALACALLAAAAAARAQEPGSELTVSLLTVDPGSQVYELFGHNAIRIRDARRGTDSAYHWGVFDFDQPGFVGRFLKGRMLYGTAGEEMAQFLYQYQYFNRTVHEQHLNLTPPQRKALHDFVRWNILPENSSYRYDYYRDNCSTRVRDAIDRAIGGALRAALESRPGASYRFHTQAVSYQDLPLYTGMMLAMGPGTDQPIRAWEASFIPMELREEIGSVLISGPNGPAPLTLGNHILFQAEREPLAENPPNLLLVYLAVGMVLAGLFALVGSLRSRAGHIGFGVVAGLWSLVVGLVGTILAALWAFTDHVMTYRNENLLQANPLSLFLIVALIAVAFGSVWGRRAATRLSLVVAGLGTLGLAIQVLPGIDQVNGEMIALLLPPHIAIAWVLARARPLSPSPAPGV